MPKIGEIARAKNIGYKGSRSNKLVWSRCPACGKERWVFVRHEGKLCKSCVRKGKSSPRPKMDKSSSWKGGRLKTPTGYIMVHLSPDDWFYPMANTKGWVREHRLIIAKHLNRLLLSWEVVHHKNGIKDDNRLENLQLLPTRKYHLADTALRRRLSQLEKRVTLLEAENTLLRERVPTSGWGKTKR